MARAARGGRKTITQETGISGSFKDTEYKEGGGRYEGPAPAPGLYPMKLAEVEAWETSDTAMRWSFDITEGKYAGWRDWVYSDMENSKWKTQQILVALGVIEPNEDINKTYEQIKKEAEPFRGRVTNEIYNNDTKGRLSAFLKGLGTTAPADADDDADEEDEDFDDKKKPAARSSRKTMPDEGPDSADEGDEPEEREAREDELSELKLPALKKVAKEAGLTLADYRGKSEEELVELILDKEFPEGDDEEDQEDGIDLDALEEELEGLDLKQLTAKAKEFGATRAELKGLDEEELIDLILEKAEEQNPSF